MASKERELLEEIANGTMSWGPSDTSFAAHEKFKAELPELTDALDWLVSEDYIGGYDDSHTESYTGKGYHDRVLITGGLTFKGQDRSTWPD
jgi:hypothetical protein